MAKERRQRVEASGGGTMSGHERVTPGLWRRLRLGPRNRGPAVGGSGDRTAARYMQPTRQSSTGGRTVGRAPTQPVTGTKTPGGV